MQLEGKIHELLIDLKDELEHEMLNAKNPCDSAWAGLSLRGRIDVLERVIKELEGALE